MTWYKRELCWHVFYLLHEKQLLACTCVNFVPTWFSLSFSLCYVHCFLFFFLHQSKANKICRCEMEAAKKYYEISAAQQHQFWACRCWKAKLPNLSLSQLHVLTRFFYFSSMLNITVATALWFWGKQCFGLYLLWCEGVQLWRHAFLWRVILG